MKIKGVLGLRKIHSNVQPYFFTDIEELKDIALSPKYPIAKIVKKLQQRYPDKKFGVVVRGCDERALIELAKRNHVNLKNLKLIGLACTKKEAEECLCKTPYPKKIDVGEKVEGIKKDELIDKIDKLKSIEEKFDFWKNVLSKCIKCYGCRDSCPVCNCDECMLEKREWVEGGKIPPEFPTFHLIRMYHVSVKCVGCNECELACPMEIPLASLQRFIREDILKLFDYVAGEDISELPPLITTLEEVPIKEVEG